MSTHQSRHPAIDYSAKDFAGFRRLLLDAKREMMPEWTSESPNDFGVVLIELFSYVGDILSFYGDRIANEAFLSTATNRASLVDIARMLDYRPTGVTAATVDVHLEVDGEVTIPAGTRFSTQSFLAATQSQDPPIFFESTEEVTFNGDGVLQLREGVTIQENVGVSSGRLDQEMALNEYPVVDLTVEVYVDEGLGPVQWTYVERLIMAGSNRNAFTTTEHNDGIITIRFGDNVNGRVPAQGAEITAVYRVGAGERGNVGPNTITEAHADDSELQQKILSVSNPEEASGGSDQESPNSIRRNAPLTLTSMHRAVTLEDHAHLALDVQGIAKAKAEQVGYNTVAVYIAPFGTSTVASTEKKNEVQEFLETRKMSNITIFVEDPIFVPINITIDVVVEDAFPRQQTEDSVSRRVLDLLEFDAVEFGHFFPVSKVYEAVSLVDGVAYANVDVLDRDSGTGKDNIQLEALEIPTVGDIEINTSGGILHS